MVGFIDMWSMNKWRTNCTVQFQEHRECGRQVTVSLTHTHAIEQYCRLQRQWEMGLKDYHCDHDFEPVGNQVKKPNGEEEGCEVSNEEN